MTRKRSLVQLQYLPPFPSPPSAGYFIENNLSTGYFKLAYEEGLGGVGGDDAFDSSEEPAVAAGGAEGG